MSDDTWAPMPPLLPSPQYGREWRRPRAMDEFGDAMKGLAWPAIGASRFFIQAALRAEQAAEAERVIERATASYVGDDAPLGAVVLWGAWPPGSRIGALAAAQKASRKIKWRTPAPTPGAWWRPTLPLLRKDQPCP